MHWGGCQHVLGPSTHRLDCLPGESPVGPPPASSTAAKYSSKAVLQRSVGTPSDTLPCSTRAGDVPAPGSGRRGRRFKSCHPDQCGRSLTCANAALRLPATQFSPPADAQKEQKRNTREPQGKPGPNSDRQKIARPPSTAQQTPRAQQGPSGHSDPPSATKRPFGRNARPARKQRGSCSSAGPAYSGLPRTPPSGPFQAQVAALIAPCAANA